MHLFGSNNFKFKTGLYLFSISGLPAYISNLNATISKPNSVIKSFVQLFEGMEFEKIAESLLALENLRALGYVQGGIFYKYTLPKNAFSDIPTKKELTSIISN
jgi:hypothetical protein